MFQFLELGSFHPSTPTLKRR